MRSTLVFILLISFSSIHAADQSPDIKLAAQACFACHGERGISPNELWPNLAGQKKGYMLKQLQDFRSGYRKNPLMEPFVKSLTDQDISNVVEYFSSLQAAP